MSKGKDFAETFGNFTNTYGCDVDGFIEGFSRQHRTLQQSMLRVMLATIEHVASDKYSFDARNEESHKVAKKLIQGFKKELKEEIKIDNPNMSEENLLGYVENDFCKPSRFLGSI